MAWIHREKASYWALFVFTFLAIAIWESYRPRRRLAGPAERRWGVHALILTLSGVAQTLIFRFTTPMLVAAAVANSPWALLNRPWLPFAVRAIAGVLLLDFVHYLVHRTFHSVYFLWRIHEVHHSDSDYDVSTAARFHPIEVVLVQGANLAAVALLGPPPIAVLIAELLSEVLNLTAHANASLPGGAERLFRMVFVTPDMHRIHHSEDIAEQGRNLGQTFTWWDRMLGTYLSQPKAGQEEIRTGLVGYDDGANTGLGSLLAAPFRTKAESQESPAPVRPGS